MPYLKKLKAIKRLVMLAAIKQSVGWLLMSFAVLCLWHLGFREKGESDGFMFVGLVAIGMFVTGIQALVSGYIQTRQYDRKSEEFISRMHQALVETGDLKTTS